MSRLELCVTERGVSLRTWLQWGKVKASSAGTQITQTPLKFHLSLLERIWSCRKGMKIPRAEQMMQEFLSLLHNC